MGILPAILQRCKAKGYIVFDGSADFDLNIIGERFNTVPNTFDDILHVVYKCNGLWQWEQFKCTTDPGTYHLLNPAKVAGTAILAPGQYRRSHELGLHRGKYEALVQRGPVKVFRDDTRDAIVDVHADNTQIGYYGINIHKAGQNSTYVNKWSAGCTVISNEVRYNRFIDLCKAQVQVNGWSHFSYTLLLGGE